MHNNFTVHHDETQIHYFKMFIETSKSTLYCYYSVEMIYIVTSSYKMINVWM